MKIDSTTTRQNGEVENGVNDSSLPSQKQQPLPQTGLNVEWSEDRGRLSRMGGLAYFAEFLESTGMFESLVAECPLNYESNNAPSKRDVLGTILLSTLQGHTRYAHMASLVAREAITSRPMYLMHPAKVSTHQSQRTLRIFCAHSEMKQIQERLEEAAQRLKIWTQLTAEQLKQAGVWTRVIAHILLNHHTIGAGDSRAPPALTSAV